MEKKKIKFNIVDFIVAILLIGVIAFVSFQLLSGKIETALSGGEATYKITFFTEESTMYSLEAVKEGDDVSDEANDIAMGKVTQININEKSCAQLETADGTYVTAPREGYGSASVVFEGTGVKYNHGAKFDFGEYSIGQTVTLRVGKAKLYGRIRDIETVK